MGPFLLHFSKVLHILYPLWVLRIWVRVKSQAWGWDRRNLKTTEFRLCHSCWSVRVSSPSVKEQEVEQRRFENVVIRNESNVVARPGSRDCSEVKLQTILAEDLILDVQHPEEMGQFPLISTPGDLTPLGLCKHLCSHALTDTWVHSYT